MQSWNTRWIIPSLRSSSARVSPPWCPAGLVSAPPSDLWDTCLLIFIYSFIYSAQILARHTHTQSLVESDCRDEIVHLPGGGEPRETCLDSALLWGHCLANWKISCTLCPWWFKSLSFSLCFFFFLFLALVNEIFKQFWCYIDSSSWISSGDKNSFPFQSNFHEEFLYKRWINALISNNFFSRYEFV